MLYLWGRFFLGKIGGIIKFISTNYPVSDTTIKIDMPSTKLPFNFIPPKVIFFFFKYLIFNHGNYYYNKFYYFFSVLF